MHRYPDVVAPDIFSDFLESVSEETLPVERADRVRGERHKVRGYPEEEYVVRNIEMQHPVKAIQVVTNGFHQTFFGVRPEAKGTIAFAPNCPVYTWIPDFHSFALCKPLYKKGQPTFTEKRMGLP
jgi:hypothetical protein